MKFQPALLASSLAILSFTACKKEPAPTTQEPELAGGKGGAATLRITARHHNRPIDSCMVYIKYKAEDAPTSYDDSAKVVRDAGVPIATFSGLLKGNYYLYGYGYDPTITNAVKGGIPYEITEEKSINISLPVTEGD